MITRYVKFALDCVRYHTTGTNALENPRGCAETKWGHEAVFECPIGGHHVEFNRNQFFMLGVVILLFGIQFRVVDQFVLNEKTSKFYRENFGQSEQPETQTPSSFLGTLAPSTPKVSHKVVHPPPWLGWCFISIGAIVVLHSLVMKRPG